MVNKNNTHLTITVNNIMYSGTDIRVFAAINQDYISNFVYDKANLNEFLRTIELPLIHTLSYSNYRDKMPVHKLGVAHAAGFTRGMLTIAGTMIFTVGYEMVFSELLKLITPDFSDETTVNDELFYRIDQLPPIDIFINFENEVGAFSRMAIFGVEFINEGQVHSVQDLVTENSINYVARHVMPLRKIHGPISDINRFTTKKIRNIAPLRLIDGNEITQQDIQKAKSQLSNLRKRFL